MYIALQKARDLCNMTLRHGAIRLGWQRVLTVNVRGIDIKIKEHGRQAGVGALVWESARVMSRVLEERSQELRDASVLELGAGTGYCALVAGALGAGKVVATEQATFRLPGASRLQPGERLTVLCRGGALS